MVCHCVSSQDCDVHTYRSMAALSACLWPTWMISLESDSTGSMEMGAVFSIRLNVRTQCSQKRYNYDRANSGHTRLYYIFINVSVMGFTNDGALKKSLTVKMAVDFYIFAMTVDIIFVQMTLF